ncbi:hypothetical protein [Streptomyces sp. NPDC092952]|uniref:hypothetical protein n=1 Tax=Streptomyces sp. NPDC092952 TaxID=3366018 RepID=UPI003816F4F7
MTDLSGLIADCLRRCDEDAARAVAHIPAGQVAIVVVTPVLAADGYRAELEPMAYYRPGEASRG